MKLLHLHLLVRIHGQLRELVRLKVEIYIRRKERMHHEIIASSSVSGNTRANKRKETASSSVGGNKRANKRKETVSSLFNRSIRVNKGNDANKYFKEGRFLKALELYEEIQGQQACCKLS
ncbi:hypothetical protein F8M41_009433 [Gigaspora margarita]|uniref:Uncharacterized protein n=1 Tax=Gigaspora margarita TaxID=4874 RepID=A0A8H3X305_GIGMA|nr:hypothetical protein F8M41_009433 [Gigaspora margarita]